MPTFGSLFAGIGGIDLGLERAGWVGRWQVENEPFCQRVLAKHWPDVPRYGDIHDVDWSLVEPVDLVAGGFPCQPVSTAGRRLIQDDDRWLWPEFARCLRALRPRYVLVENVPGLLVGGGMDEVLGDLASIGYDTEWESIPASAVGAPHLRYRVWIVAYAYGLGPRRPTALGPSSVTGLREAEAGAEPHGAGDGALADATGIRPQGSNHTGSGLAMGLSGESAGGGAALNGRSLADAASLGSSGPREHVEPLDPATGSDGQAGQPRDGRWWSLEPDLGRVVDGFSAGLDGSGGLSAHESCLAKARAKGLPRTDRLRVLREYLGAATPSSRSSRCALCSHPLSALPCGGTCSPWYLGSGTTPDEDLRCLREGVYALGTRQAGEDLLARVPRYPWATGGEQTMAPRTDRLRSLGNAVVPQVVEFIGRRILEAEALT